MNIILSLFAGVVTSLVIFPFELSFLIGANTKMVVAGIGLILLAIRYTTRMNSLANADFLRLLLWGGLVSLAGLISVVYNNTSDFVYATYIVSMLVWLSASFVLVSAIRVAHGKVSVGLLVNYMVAVCVGQCLLALLMDMNAPLKGFVDSFLVSDGFMGKNEERLYGLGCALDVAGTRFSAVLIMLAFLCVNSLESYRKMRLVLYTCAFLIISVIGNMISRTTTIGVIFSVCYWLGICILPFAQSVQRRIAGMRILKYIIVTLMIFIPVIIWGYENNASMHANIRFAFEGFFSMIEKGHWETTSNNRLADMVVFPDQMKTWLIGDGYFGNPYDSDIFYIGNGGGTYYMNTDIGYLRFIFYFGVMGTFLFCVYMFVCSRICMCRHTEYKVMFLFLLFANYIFWFKVSTDIFLIFAPFLCFRSDECDVKCITE